MKKTLDAVAAGCQRPGCGGFRGVSTLALMLMAVAGSGLTVHAQGMPPTARQNIHTLFDDHDRVTRELTLTPDGYEAVTQSKDGWTAHATSHPAVLARSNSGERVETGATTCRSGKTQGRGHCHARCHRGVPIGPAAQAGN